MSDHILVVVNGLLTGEGRASARDRSPTRSSCARIADSTSGATRTASTPSGTRIADYDEVILANDTWYGPIRPFGPVFERMDRQALHFWGMTDHARVEPHPFTWTGYLPYHLQSYWVAVRREMFLSADVAATIGATCPR